MPDYEDYKPIQGPGGAHTEEGWVFHVPGKDLEISAFQQEINEILMLSNGVNRVH